MLNTITLGCVRERVSSLENDSMAPRPTPRLCAHCGKDLEPEEGYVSLQGAQTCDPRYVHRSCFEEHYRRVDQEGELENSS